jgi:lantibiotic modifying enzyme
VTGEVRYGELALAATRAIRSRLREPAVAEKRAIGAFQSLGGTLYYFAHAASLWPDLEVLRDAESILARLPALIDSDEDFDVISGAAGCIAVLLSGLVRWPRRQARRAGAGAGSTVRRASPRAPSPCPAASRGGDRLRCAPDRPLSRRRWDRLGSCAPLPGIGRRRFLNASRRAFEYERGLYSAEHGNWPDLRRFSDAAANCASAGGLRDRLVPRRSGIGLSRLSSCRDAEDGASRGEILAALATTLSRLGANHSLCHGDLGNLDFAMQAAELLGDAAAMARAERLTSSVLCDIEERGWRCGTPGTVETPGLMVGLAGIGLALLRLAAPSRVPSVLALAPPLARQSVG